MKTITKVKEVRGNNTAGFQTLGDLEEAASRNANKTAWAYVQGGAGEEWTLKSNREAFHRRTFRPRVLVNVEKIDISAKILSEESSAPFYVSPTASHGVLHAQAERCAARAASVAGIPAGFSTLSTISMEAIAAVAPEGTRWFQLYLQPDFKNTEKLIVRAERAGFQAIILTVDMPLSGVRDREVLSGYGVESPVPLGNGAQVVRPMRAPTLNGADAFVREEASANWEVVDQIQKTTRLPIVVKGILTAEDAKLAADHGVKGIIVSNHGGRQLEGAPASLDALPEIVKAVGSRVEVFFDGGVRRGSDVLMALAEGAKAVGLGRLVLWALAAGGEAGVSRMLGLLKAELATEMALTGRRTVSEIDKTLLGPMRW